MERRCSKSIHVKLDYLERYVIFQKNKYGFTVKVFVKIKHADILCEITTSKITYYEVLRLNNKNFTWTLKYKTTKIILFLITLKPDKHFKMFCLLKN